MKQFNGFYTKVVPRFCERDKKTTINYSVINGRQFRRNFPFWSERKYDLTLSLASRVFTIDPSKSSIINLRFFLTSEIKKIF